MLDAGVRNPFLDLDPECYCRDPLLIHDGGTFHCFYTAVERAEGRYFLHLDTVESPDLLQWSQPRRVLESPLGISSPGSVIRVGQEWVMCVQSYPIPEGERHADESARLFLLKSPDLRHWSDLLPIKPQGAEVAWTDSHRQIDPCLVEHDGRYWCLYKTGGCLGMLVSDDLDHWTEASPDRPVLSAADTPDGRTVENPSVMRDGGEFVMFFAPCRKGRGVGVARSDDLLRWRDVRYLEFPPLDWASNGPTAAMVADLREVCGKWVMLFHGERELPHSAALGIAWSDDLENWVVP